MRRGLARALLPLAPWLLLAGPGAGASVPPGGAAPQAPPEAPAQMMTGAQLEDCLRREREIEREAARLRAAAARLQAGTRVSGAPEPVASPAPSRDRRPVPPGAQEMEAGRGLEARLRRAVEEHNAQVQRLNEEVAAFNRACANQFFLESEYARLRSRLGG